LLSGKTFPGYLNTENLIKTVSLLGVYLSIGEARELSLLIAPEKRGMFVGVVVILIDVIVAVIPIIVVFIQMIVIMLFIHNFLT
jgi:hypothetical protein